MDDRKNLLSQINSLNLNLEQYIEIYKIIKLDSNIKIMKNNNGVFINLYDISDDIIKKLKDFIFYISTNDLSKNI
tara:strand:+ start:897 stop:1121 length:225 start_codon:yes stop_codon:yes gene_type:complete